MKPLIQEERTARHVYYCIIEERANLPHCSVPFVPHAKFTRPQFTGPAFVNPWIAIGLRGIERIAEDPRTWVWGQGSNLRPRIAIQVQSEWAQFRSNRCAIRLNCLRIAKNPESIRNRADCKYRGLNCGWSATTQKSSFRGLRVTER